MRHRHRYNLALLAVVVVLGLAALLAPEPSNSPPSLTPADPATVERAEIDYPRGDREPVRLERGDNGWRLVSPIERRARDGRIVTALGVLAAASDSCYRSAEHEPADFGLESPRVVLRTGDVEVAFGDRAADSRRYVRAGERLCLLDDRSLPLLAEGVDGLGAAELIPPASTPAAIRTPAAAAERAAGGGWTLVRGSGDAAAWARHWRSARGAFHHRRAGRRPRCDPRPDRGRPAPSVARRRARARAGGRSRRRRLRPRHRGGPGRAPAPAASGRRGLASGHE